MSVDLATWQREVAEAITELTGHVMELDRKWLPNFSMKTIRDPVNTLAELELAGKILTNTPEEQERASIMTGYLPDRMNPPCGHVIVECSKHGETLAHCRCLGVKPVRLVNCIPACPSFRETEG